VGFIVRAIRDTGVDGIALPAMQLRELSWSTGRQYREKPRGTGLVFRRGKAFRARALL
jgi:hypothetical protein